MASREIKTKLTLDGEQKFKSAMKDSANAIKVLNSEMKVADAQFKATGDAQEHNAEKARILREQIEEQKKAVEAAEQALEAMRAKGVEPNNQAFQRWQTSLNSAKARLIGMQADLSGVESDINGLSDSMADGEAEAENYGGALASINSQVSFETVIRAVDNVRDRISGLAKTIVSVAGSVWGLMRDAGQWADDLSTEAEIYGISTTELQQWRYAADQVNVSVEDIIKARKRITQEMGKALKEGADNPLNELNVGVLDAENNYRDANEVFWDTINALGQVEDITRRNQLANDLFGKSYDELIPLINAGRDGFEKFAEEAPTLDEDSVQSLNEAQSAFKTLDSTLTTTKYELLALFADSFRDIAQAITDTVNAFREWSQTEEGKAALDGLAQAVENIVTAFGEDADFSVLVGKATGLVNNFTDALSWLTKDENIDKVKGGITAIAAAWGILTVGKVGLSVAQGVSALKGLAASGGGGAISSAASGAAANSGGSAIGTAAGGASIWGSVKAAAADVGIVALPAAIAAAYSYGFTKLLAAEENTAEKQQVYGSYEHFDASETAIGRMTEDVADAVQRYWEVYQDEGSEQAMEAREALVRAFAESGVILADDATNLIEDTFDEAIRGVDNSGLVEEMAKQIPGIFEEAVEEAKSGNVQGRIFDNLEQFFADTTKGGLDKASTGRIFENLEQFFADAIQEDMAAVVERSIAFGSGRSGFVPDFSGEPVWRVAEQSAEGAESAVTEAWSFLPDLSETFGEDVTTGFAEGITTGMPDIMAQAELAAMMAERGITDPLGINSPSKVMYDHGLDVGAGLANGIYASAPAVAAAAAYLASIVQSVVVLGLGIHSPSKVMAGLGEFTGEGFAQGIEDSIWRVERATSRMVEATQQTPVYGARSAGAAGQGGDIRAYIVMDKEIVGEMVAPVIDGYIGASIIETR